MAQTQVLDLYNHPQYTTRERYIQQQVERIFKTPLGSVPGRLGFGATLHTMVSYPQEEWPTIVNECFRAMDESGDYWIKLVQVVVDFEASTPRTLILNPVIKDLRTDKEFTLSAVEVSA